MLVREIMRSDVEVVHDITPIIEVAQKMKERNVGSIPVRKGDRLVGMITDRDLVVRGLARGVNPKTTTVSQCMSGPIVYVYDDQPIEDAAHLMEDKHIHRLPVLNQQKRLIGIVSLTDIGAYGQDDNLAGGTLRHLSGVKGHVTASSAV